MHSLLTAPPQLCNPPGRLLALRMVDGRPPARVRAPHWGLHQHVCDVGHPHAGEAAVAARALLAAVARNALAACRVEMPFCRQTRCRFYAHAQAGFDVRLVGSAASYRS